MPPFWIAVEVAIIIVTLAAVGALPWAIRRERLRKVRRGVTAGAVARGRRAL